MKMLVIKIILTFSKFHNFLNANKVPSINYVNTFSEFSLQLN